ncbi:putative GMP synthase [Daphnia magna]|uniref:Putative GMP synthase n=1 Tax=Daphnia magna TaxID=35525 RepID=A0A162CU42_9CRUS|nr:putative GMP synthase [Daphnia magna]
MNFTLPLNSSQFSLRGGCPTIRPSNFYLWSPKTGNLLRMQLLNKELGGTVERKDVREDGQFEIQVETGVPIV